ncbi:hypothetical protein E0L36_22250 [Streptomyces sp. AJS327]|uniref:hypothetical protein n=1 Tax=Streptomyces sp. AJS327 TaxID=2545265 RepID=UPI0015DDE294|nr:hypothetical protein [Streptomyces sp. AJS327]MBA0053500.1 hypothetical protein [Streptomyces sp. AJS327]
MKPHPLAVIPRHDDGTLCGHSPADTCPGTGDLLALCACGWRTTGTVRLGLTALHGEHARVLTGGDR